MKSIIEKLTGKKYHWWERMNLNPPLRESSKYHDNDFRPELAFLPLILEMSSGRFVDLLPFENRIVFSSDITSFGLRIDTERVVRMDSE